MALPSRLVPTPSGSRCCHSTPETSAAPLWFKPQWLEARWPEAKVGSSRIRSLVGFRPENDPYSRNRTSRSRTSGIDDLSLARAGGIGCAVRWPWLLRTARPAPARQARASQHENKLKKGTGSERRSDFAQFLRVAARCLSPFSTPPRQKLTCSPTLPPRRYLPRAGSHIPSGVDCEYD